MCFILLREVFFIFWDKVGYLYISCIQVFPVSKKKQDCKNAFSMKTNKQTKTTIKNVFNLVCLVGRCWTVSPCLNSKDVLVTQIRLWDVFASFAASPALLGCAGSTVMQGAPLVLREHQGALQSQNATGILPDMARWCEGWGQDRAVGQCRFGARTWLAGCPAASAQRCLRSGIPCLEMSLLCAPRSSPLRLAVFPPFTFLWIASLGHCQNTMLSN